MGLGLAGMLATTGACAWFATRALRGDLRLRRRRTPAAEIAAA
jgi:hypothetical protein